MDDQEAHNFVGITVDSFSQLPFIRPSPPAPDRPSNSPPAIRLFGFDVPQEPNSSQIGPSEVYPNSAAAAATTADTSADANSGETGGNRKFECHYCCRNFPTSQALGGHQNAHKRERQHAKRAQLHSAMAAHRPNFVADVGKGHMYSYLNYHRLSSVPSAGRFEHPAPSYYTSWTSNAVDPYNLSSGSRFYGGLGSVLQPIDGTPMPELWRTVPVHGDVARFGMVRHDQQMVAPPFFRAGTDARVVELTSSPSSSSSSTTTSPRGQGGLNTSVKTSLSLDLRL